MVELVGDDRHHADGEQLNDDAAHGGRNPAIELGFEQLDRDVLVARLTRHNPPKIVIASRNWIISAAPKIGAVKM